MVALRELKPALAGLPVASCPLDAVARQQASELLGQNQPFALVSLPAGRWKSPGWLLLSGLTSADSPARLADEPEDFSDCTEIWMFAFEWLKQNHLRSSSAGNHAPASRTDATTLRLRFRNRQFFAGSPADPRPVTKRATGTEKPAPEEYTQAVDRIQAWLRAGDLYQFNLTRRFTYAGNAAALWHCWTDGCEKFRPPFAAFIHAPGHAIAASLSPEEWISSNGTDICTTPIKGTGCPAEDTLDTAKNRAEHTMIVDLERNDLARVCEPESIDTQPFCQPVDFGGISHLVSQVQGTLRPDVSFCDIVRAMGPGGSVTGAPKIAMLQKIDLVEAAPRSWYCGGIGMRTGPRTFSFNLPIRTAWIENDTIVYHSGGGIVADSTAAEEWQELQDKLYWIAACR